MHFSISIDIPAPPERVWAVMCDIERWHEWTPSVKQIRQLTRGPLGVGTRALIRQPRLPPALWKVIAIDPGRSFTWTTWSPGLLVTAHHAVEPTDAGSRATLSLEFAGWLGGIMGASRAG